VVEEQGSFQHDCDFHCGIATGVQHSLCFDLPLQSRGHGKLIESQLYPNSAKTVNFIHCYIHSDENGTHLAFNVCGALSYKRKKSLSLSSFFLSSLSRLQNLYLNIRNCILIIFFTFYHFFTESKCFPLLLLPTLPQRQVVPLVWRAFSVNQQEREPGEMEILNR
jgi:hypothetical protein